MDTLQAMNRLEKTIESQRHLLLQAHGVLTCLYEALRALNRCSMPSGRSTESMNREFCA